jgi:hypothetical protein
LLRQCSRNQWSKQEKDILLHYRRRHLKQQQRERKYLEENIAKTYDLDPSGRPISCLLFSDGMTAFKGNIWYAIHIDEIV